MSRARERTAALPELPDLAGVELDEIRRPPGSALDRAVRRVRQDRRTAGPVWAAWKNSVAPIAAEPADPPAASASTLTNTPPPARSQSTPAQSTAAQSTPAQSVLSAATRAQARP